MDITRQRWLLLGMLWVLPLLLAAADQAQFEAEVVVTDQTPAVRASALRKALGDVLVRVTGRADVTGTDAARSLLNKPEALLQQYRYFTESGQEPPLLKLWVRFDGDAIRETLQQQGVAYWGGERPLTLVWVAVDDRGNRYVLSADDSSAVRGELDSAAQARGVPLLYPLMDLEDQSRVRFADLWNGRNTAIEAASQRYQPPAMLVGRIQRMGSGSWGARWQMSIAGQSRSWSDSHPQLSALLRQGINDVADVQASVLSVSGSSSAAGDAVISVGGITSLADYARTGNYLATLSMVRAVQVEEVTPDQVQYRLRLNGTQQDFIRTVAIGSVLVPAADGNYGRYRLRQ